MAARINVYKVKSAYNVVGSLVVASSMADAVALWCKATDSRESSINDVEFLGAAYTDPPSSENRP